MNLLKKITAPLILLFGLLGTLFSIYQKGKSDYKKDMILDLHKQKDKNQKLQEKVSNHYDNIDKNSKQANSEIDRINKLVNNSKL